MPPRLDGTHEDVAADLRPIFDDQSPVIKGAAAGNGNNGNITLKVLD